MISVKKKGTPKGAFQLYFSLIRSQRERESNK